ncbi:MAG: peptidylprolyl isomerase, partial [Oscillospiraceae bacterium]
PNFDQGHAPFGQVIKGLEVVDEIIQVPVDENYKPAESLRIQSVTIAEVTQENLAEYTQP